MLPFNSINNAALSPSGIVFVLVPGCVVPSMITGSVMPGSAEAGMMVWTPAPEILKWISSGTPLLLAVALALEMASRSEPAPMSRVLVTVNVVAAQGRAAAAIKPKEHKKILVINLFFLLQIRIGLEELFR